MVTAMGIQGIAMGLHGIAVASASHYHGTAACHGTAIARHNGARSWATVAVLPLHFLRQLPCTAMALITHATPMTPTAVPVPWHRHGTGSWQCHGQLMAYHGSRNHENPYGKVVKAHMAPPWHCDESA